MLTFGRDMYCYKNDVNVICELLAVNHGDLELDLFSNSVLDAFIEFYVILPCAYIVYFCTIFVINNNSRINNYDYFSKFCYNYFAHLLLELCSTYNLQITFEM